MNYPLTIQQRLGCIARETARMSFPGSMSRGFKPIIVKGAKQKIEEYFVSEFPLAELSANLSQVVAQFDA